MESNDSNARRAAWGAYWASGRLHSCVNSSGSNYRGAIGDFWRQWLLSLEPGARVLDLATGNGPLPRLLAELRQDAVEIDAVDFASIAPGWHDTQKQPSIRFHTGARMEALPFPDAVFDAVISQYGFEYAIRPEALAECVRVAKSGSRIALVMHHAGSALIDVGREELHHHAQLVAQDGLLTAATEVIPWMAKIRSGMAPDGRADQARGLYNVAMSRLADAVSRSTAPDLLLEARSTVHGLISRLQRDEEAILMQLRSYADALEAARLRTSEMVACALTKDDIEALAHQLTELRPGTRVEYDELRQEEGCVAWLLLARLLGE
ncbi:class I SAM-dependent methyltransferase [Pseudoxanthomonas japonensis]|uniref:Methyltransferase type 11 domain-containing protein n=1 Tax=Pseudoxanthomonas japonensis TaxID=69284 RepID=A0ABQ6ZD31_9GAMM|nr:methyltransferase domain-containing protein [Pseudoxanthomonas japonensis]KAF1722496.1 hypothetical protein CSC78_17210 [Pseudoxanthomonas japonensis]